ncbi:MAG: hypothetical protein H0U60_00145, partial [Blastocatellia bacterium]|nr:hypothetical protein [Blastocatellia bacterium]
MSFFLRIPFLRALLQDLILFVRHYYYLLIYISLMTMLAVASVYYLWQVVAVRVQ